MLKRVCSWSGCADEDRPKLKLSNGVGLKSLEEDYDVFIMSGME